MKRSQFPNRFDFYDDGVFDHEVEAMSTDEFASIVDLDRFLFFREQTTVPQRNDERSMVNSLNESRPKLFMNVDCRANGLTNNSFDLRCDGFRCLVVRFVALIVFFGFFVFFVLFVVPVSFVALFVSFVLFVANVSFVPSVVHGFVLRVFVVAFALGGLSIVVAGSSFVFSRLHFIGSRMSDRCIPSPIANDRRYRPSPPHPGPF
jgi:hypothetical protein